MIGSNFAGADLIARFTLGIVTQTVSLRGRRVRTESGSDRIKESKPKRASVRQFDSKVLS